MMPIVAPKMDCFLETLEQATQLDLPLDVVKVRPVSSRQQRRYDCDGSFQAHYGDLVVAAGVLEVAGGLLFILDFSLGASLLVRSARV